MFKKAKSLAALFPSIEIGAACDYSLDYTISTLFESLIKKKDIIIIKFQSTLKYSSTYPLPMTFLCYHLRPTAVHLY